jgi:hypothetical protein
MKIKPQYKGVIIEESLKDNLILNEFKIVGLSVTKEKNPADRWHMYAVEGSEEVIEKLPKLIKPSKWYAHFWNGRDMIAVFSDKIFRFKYDDQIARNESIEYGISIGIPKKQLDFLIS